jgi:purine-nucleoside phosphorylase
MISTTFQQLKEARDFYKSSFPNANPESVVILGSGLGPVADEHTIINKIAFSDLPYFCSPSIEGHSGEIVLAKLKNDKQALFFKGRLHAYEGHDYDKVLFAVRWAHLMGCKNLVVTNAAGSVNLDFKPGDLVLIKDHINMSGKNPLMGKNVEELGPRFPDMTVAYDFEFRQKLKIIANKHHIELKEGVYGYVMGPTYETPAEIKMLRIIGADMVGMSTAPDVIAARHVGMRVLGISCITNCGAGITEHLLKHDDVKIEAAKAMNKMKTLINEFLISGSNL